MKKSLFDLLKRIMPLGFSSCPVYLTISLVIAVLHGLSHGMITLSLNHTFDVMADALNQNITINYVYLAIAALGGALVFNHMINGLHNIISEDVASVMMKKIGSKLHMKVATIDPVNFENKKFLDDLEKAKNGVMSIANFLFVFFMIVTYYLPYFIFMGIYLYRLKPILAISVVLIFLPVALSQFIRVKAFTQLSDQSANHRRRYEYYEACITNKSYLKETRVLGVTSYFKGLFKTALQKNHQAIWQTEKKVGLHELGMKSLTLLGYVGVLFLLFDALKKQEITVGAFFAVFTSIDLMFKIMNEIITSHIGRLSKNYGSIVHYLDFMSFEASKDEMELKDSLNEISLKNVSFKYPGSEKMILKNISLSISKGEKLAIVGENGAGKSTLSKLLMGLYSPTEGQLFFNGLDIKLLKKASVLKSSSAVFQDYQRYKLTLKENVQISDLDVNADAKVMASLNQSNMKKEGYLDTNLSREFGGTDLSGGEWQKIAIARGQFKPHSLVVFDEPTASIDPVEETRLLGKINEMAQNATAIIITHRMGSIKFVDKIVVLKEGEIAAIGTHHELIKSNGYYASLYDTQKSMYEYATR